MPYTIEGLPSFNHPEVAELYQKGLRIEASELQAILDLPHLTLVQDLERILADTTERFAYYENLFDEELEDDFQDAALHAIMLLGEVQAKEALPTILKWLEGSDEFLEFWLGDHRTETIWEAVYKLMPDEWDILEVFLRKSGVNMFARGAVIQALNQLALQQPEYRAAVISFYEQLLTYYHLHPSETEGDDFVSLLVSGAFEIQARELIPLITTLHNTVELDEMVTGSKEEIEKDMEWEPRIMEVLPITERYQKILTTWSGYTEEDDDFEEEDQYEEYADWYPQDKNDEPELLPIRTEPKIGRNDPCPCGSGKKYKKCCLNAQEAQG